jgi:thiamine pyrophosphokinase
MAARPALVFAGGDAPPASVREHLAPDALSIAADSGLEHAQTLGRAVDVVVGDLDSVDPAALARATAAGATVEAHPPDKDATDLELALDAAVERGATAVTVVGGHGGRFDHLLANALLLGHERYAAITLDAWIDTAHVVVIRDDVTLAGAAGSLCTLLAVGGAAHGVTTHRLRYPLADATLVPGSTWGVSNVLLESTARVSVASGTVLSIQPNALEH